ncbi:MAG: hypothetical protein MMC33_009280 [Icmadophila ericetorum]|nr:hypothetical protein [Icmadophila ericetorum]
MAATNEDVSNAILYVAASQEGLTKSVSIRISDISYKNTRRLSSTVLLRLVWNALKKSFRERLTISHHTDQLRKKNNLLIATLNIIKQKGEPTSLAECFAGAKVVHHAAQRAVALLDNEAVEKTLQKFLDTYKDWKPILSKFELADAPFIGIPEPILIEHSSIKIIGYPMRDRKNCLVEEKQPV